VETSAATRRVVGRYALYQSIAAGGMATVHLGRLIGAAGFARTVAIKRLHAQFASDPEFATMFLDEARVAARIRSPNVVPIVDIVADGGELLLVMDYIQGESLARLMRAVTHAKTRVPLDVTVAVVSGMLHGLHAAHEATDEHGEPLAIVHRDVSPHNVLVGSDGLARLLDFGVAKATGRIQTTREGQLKGKLAYMAPEQLRSEPVTRRTDIYAASVVLWETLTSRRLFRAENEGGLVTAILQGVIERPSGASGRGADGEDAEALARLDAAVLRGLDGDPANRFDTAQDMAQELEACVTPATAVAVGRWVRSIAGPALAERERQVLEIESGVSNVSSMRAVASPRDAAAPPPGGTQATSISVAMEAASPVAPSARRRRTLAIGLMAAALGTLIAAIFIARGGPSSRAGTPASEASAGPAAQPSAEPTPAPSATAPPEPASSSASGASAAELSPAASASDAPARPRPTSGVVASPPHPSPAAVPRADCNPPYFWDAQGKKHYKPSCI
jgi:eukaryotic-like serine/threonine-protein kinase